MTAQSSSKIYVCTEIILEILSRLPAKPLFRFKCASKSWLSLIDGDNNLILQKALPSTLLGFFYCHDEFYRFDDDDDNNNNDSIDTSLSFLPNRNSMAIVDSCNGLLLCRMSVRDANIYYVCNPATKRWNALPSFPSTRNFALLAWDPYVSSSHYKVIVWVAIGDIVADIYVFSSESIDHGWAKETTLALEGASLFCNGDIPRSWVFLNGTFYISYGSRIIRHGLRQRTVHTLLFPVVAGQPLCECYHIAILRGAICCGKIRDSRLGIWMLVENDEDDNVISSTWVLMHNIVLEIERPFRFMAFHPRSEVVLVEKVHGIWSYDLNSNTNVQAFGGRGCPFIQGYLANLALPYTPCYIDVLK